MDMGGPWDGGDTGIWGRLLGWGGGHRSYKGVTAPIWDHTWLWNTISPIWDHIRLWDATNPTQSPGGGPGGSWGPQGGGKGGGPPTLSVGDAVGGQRPPDVDDPTAVGHFVLIDVLRGVVIIHRVHNAQIEQEAVQNLGGGK